MYRQTVLFDGEDAGGSFSVDLWETNGAAGGTSELIDISGADGSGIFADGFSPVFCHAA
jgi:hypothetical protein